MRQLWIDGVLYLDGKKEPVLWRTVVRELVKAVAPACSTCGLAFGIKETLAASSVAAATAVLDEMGYL